MTVQRTFKRSAAMAATQEDIIKKVILWLSCLVLSVSLVACGHGWKHAKVPEVKWDADYTDCVYQAESAARNSRVTKNPAQNWGAYGEVQYLTDKCMEEKGYFQADDQE